MSLSQKAIEEFMEIYKEEYGKDLSDGEAGESARNLLRYFEVIQEVAIKELQRKRQLRKQPAGFYLTDGTYSCSICGTSVSGENSWYDEWGIKCLLCQNAVREGIVPGFVCKDRDSSYRMWELKDKFQIHPQTARKMVRQGELKARTVLTKESKPYEYVFLKKENPQLISRYSPTRKSYDRYREKENNRAAREWKLEARKRLLKMKNKYKKQVDLNSKAR